MFLKDSTLKYSTNIRRLQNYLKIKFRFIINKALTYMHLDVKHCAAQARQLSLLNLPHIYQQVAQL